MTDEGKWDHGREGMVQREPCELFKLFRPRTGSTASIMMLSYSSTLLTKRHSKMISLYQDPILIF